MTSRFLEMTVWNLQSEMVALKKLIDAAQTTDDILTIWNQTRQLAESMLRVNDDAGTKADQLGTRGMFTTKE